MTTFNVVRAEALQIDPEVDVVTEDLADYARALEEVVYQADGDTLVPLNAPDVGRLRPYNVKQAWSLRDYETGERIALLGIQEVQDDE